MSRILIADDDPVSCQLLRSLLVKWNHEVIAVSDGAGAQRELQKKNPPELAILDWMMPGLDGIEVIKELRAKKKVEYTYILLLSSKTEMRDILHGLRAGADDYLTKPLDASNLKARLLLAERVLDLHHRLGRALDLSKADLMPVLAAMRRAR